MRPRTLFFIAILMSSATGCGTEGANVEVYTLRATVGQSEGLNIDDKRVLSLTKDATADDADLKLQNGYAYSLSGLGKGDRLCPQEGDFATAADIPGDGPCAQGEHIYYLGGNSPGSDRQAWQPTGFIYHRAEDGDLFRLLILDHGVESTNAGGRAFAKFELVAGDSI